MVLNRSGLAISRRVSRLPIVTTSPLSWGIVPQRGVTFFLEDGAKYWHPGPPLVTLTAIMAAMDAGNSRILSIVRKTVGASNCGLLWQIPKALAEGEDLQQSEIAVKEEEGKSGETESRARGKNRQKKGIDVKHNKPTCDATKMHIYQ